jgi:hypothetical protein
MNWIDIRIRKPTKADADKFGNVLQLLQCGRAACYWWDCLTDAVAWMPIPKFKPIDPPEGYRLIDIATEPFRKDAMVWELSAAKWFPTSNTCKYSPNSLYCVPIDTKPKYRPFANAEEFKPYRDKWVKVINNLDIHKSILRPSSYNDFSWSAWSWEEAFKDLEFDDGTPFGIKEDKNP